MQRIDWGDFGRDEPFDRDFGFHRGRPIDRYYIERFLDEHRADVRGRVLEVGDDHYAREFGTGRATRIDVVDRVPREGTTFAGDLARADTLPRGAFNCILCTQTVHLIYNVRAVLATLHHALVPGGVLLLTVPGISQIVREDMAGPGDFWRFTTRSLERLLAESFGSPGAVRSHGNVQSACAFLYGLACEDVDPAILARNDDQFQLLITARAVRP